MLLLAFVALTYVSWRLVGEQLARVPARSSDTPATYGLVFTDQRLTSADSTELASWYVPSSPSKATVILVPGLHHSKVDLLELAKTLHASQYSVLLVDLRGQGASEGSGSRLGTQEWQDVDAAYAFAKRQPEASGKKVGFVSFSMGSASTIVAAGKLGIGDFMLAAVPFADFSHLADYTLQVHHLPGALKPFLLVATWLHLGPGSFSTVPDRYIASIKEPKLLVDADKDQTVSPQDPAFLYGLASQPKELWQSPDGHFVYDDDPQAFDGHMLAFLRAVAP